MTEEDENGQKDKNFERHKSCTQETQEDMEITEVNQSPPPMRRMQSKDDRTHPNVTQSLIKTSSVKEVLKRMNEHTQNQIKIIISDKLWRDRDIQKGKVQQNIKSSEGFKKNGKGSGRGVSKHSISVRLVPATDRVLGSYPRLFDGFHT